MARQNVEIAQPSRQNWTKPGPKPWQLGTEIKGGGGDRLWADLEGMVFKIQDDSGKVGCGGVP